jgi:hypothetical protein
MHRSDIRSGDRLAIDGVVPNSKEDVATGIETCDHGIRRVYFGVRPIANDDSVVRGTGGAQIGA